MSDGTLCAHLRVVYLTREEGVGHVVEAWWECASGCGMRFAPSPALPDAGRGAEEEESDGVVFYLVERNLTGAVGAAEWLVWRDGGRLSWTKNWRDANRYDFGPIAAREARAATEVDGSECFVSEHAMMLPTAERVTEEESERDRELIQAFYDVAVPVGGKWAPAELVDAAQEALYARLTSLRTENARLREEMNAIERAVRGYLAPAHDSSFDMPDEEPPAKYVVQADDGEPIIEAQTIPELIRAVAGEWIEAGERAETAEREREMVRATTVQDCAASCCAGCRDGWPFEAGDDAWHVGPNPPEIRPCQSSHIRAILSTPPVPANKTATTTRTEP